MATLRRKNHSISDFSNKQLPVSRKAQFKDVLKRDYSLLIKIGLLFILFCLPFIATLILMDVFGQSLLNGNADSSLFLMNDLIFNAALIVSFIVIAIGISGLDRIYRLICWDEPVIFFSDFKEGVKLNFKRNLFVTLIFSLFLFVMNIGSDLFTVFLPESGVGILLFGILAGFIFLVLLPFVFVCFAFNSYYKDSFKHLLKNSIAMTVFRYIPLVLFALPFVLLFLLYLFTNAMALVIYAIIAIFIGPIFGLGWHLCILSVFDFYINPNYKEYYKKGLYVGGLENEKD